jgi:hypothetical protein
MHFSPGAIIFCLVDFLIAFVNHCFSAIHTVIPTFGDAQLILFQIFTLLSLAWGKQFVQHRAHFSARRLASFFALALYFAAQTKTSDGEFPSTTIAWVYETAGELDCSVDFGDISGLWQKRKATF